LSGLLDFYELPYSQREHSNEENSFIFASVLSDALNKIGTKSILGEHKAFVKIDEKMLFSDKIFTVSNEFFIFSLNGDMEITTEVQKRVERLRARGYIFAIDGFVPSSDALMKHEEILNRAYFVKIKFDDMRSGGDVKNSIAELKDKNIIVVATDIFDKDRYDLAKELGCEEFQGYYFSKPKVFCDKEYKPPRLDILKLYSLLVENAELEVITEEFKKNNAITVLLLRYINSGAFHFKNRISSIHHILTLVGREPLVKWLMLVIYSIPKSSNTKVSPLMLMIKNRTEMMERILKAVVPDAGKSMLNQAYFVGVLSLMDAVFEESLEKILDEMNVYEVVRDALLHDGDILGEIYALVRDIEAFEPASMIEFEERHGLESGTLARIVIESMHEVSAFEAVIAAIEG
jgi:EAL and modified HD-GYP domain-containing signal transduction protein